MFAPLVRKMILTFDVLNVCCVCFVQLQMLIAKKGAVSPLYLHQACEDLRSFASFDKVRCHFV